MQQEIDVKAGGGHVMTIGEMLRQWLVKLEWYSTLFPRIPVPIEKDLAVKLKSRPVVYRQPEPEPEHVPDNQVSFGEAERRGGCVKFVFFSILHVNLVKGYSVKHSEFVQVAQAYVSWTVVNSMWI